MKNYFFIILKTPYLPTWFIKRKAKKKKKKRKKKKCFYC